MNKNNSKDSSFYFKRGTSKYESGDYQGAIKDYTKAIEIDPYTVLLYVNRGNAKGRGTPVEYRSASLSSTSLVVLPILTILGIAGLVRT